MRKFEIEKVIDELEEISRVSTMETAGFMSHDFTLEATTSFVKKVTRLWRETWITDPLQRIIDDLKKEIRQ